MKKLIGSAVLAGLIATGPALATDANDEDLRPVGDNPYSYEAVLPIVYGDNVPDFSIITEASHIEVVGVMGMTDTSDENLALLEETLEGRDATALHENVADNAALSAAVQQAGFSADQVVAIARQGDEDRYIVYVDDRDS
jgi:hypothetical protein